MARRTTRSRRSTPTPGEPIDLDRFDHVAVWCKRFGATFTVAMLT